MRFTLTTTLLFLFVIPGACIADIVSTFDSGLEGWGHATGGDAGTSISWVPTDGNPDGHIRIVEPANGATDWFVAPAKFLGDKSASYGGTFSYDTQRIDTGQQVVTDQDLLFRGAGLEIVLENPIAASTSQFLNFSYQLDETAGWVLSSGGAPTQAQFQAILGDLTTVQIIAEWTNSQDTTMLDNVRLTSVPEPGSLAIMLLATIPLACLNRRRRQTEGMRRKIAAL